MTIINENQNDTGVATLTCGFIKREDMPYPITLEKEIRDISFWVR